MEAGSVQGGTSTGGSITANGLQHLLDSGEDPVSGYPNVLVVVSAQGSFDDDDRAQAVSLATQLRERGGQRVCVGGGG